MVRGVARQTGAVGSWKANESQRVQHVLYARAPDPESEVYGRACTLGDRAAKLNKSVA